MTEVILVTGASRGIGEATARLFASRGWSVALVARSGEDIVRISGEIEAAGGRALAIPTDITDWNAVEEMVERTVSHFGRLDAVVNNAGRGTLGAVASSDMEKVEGVFRLNVLAPVAVMKAAVPHLRANPDGGSVVNVSSMAENIALPLLGIYSATKISLSYLSDAARAELSHANVRVTNVLPSSTTTGFGGNLLRTGDTDDFVFDERIASEYGGGVPARDVAESIWRAVDEGPRSISVSGVNGVLGKIVRAFPEATNSLLTFGLDRYVPRKGHEVVSPTSDVAKVGVAVGIAVVAAVWGRRRRRAGING